MKIALVVYSLTGHTRSVAEQIKEKLAADGHETDYYDVTPEPKKDKGNPAEKQVFINSPELDGYDICIFGAYTEAFSLSRVMQQYLAQLNSSNSKAICLTTQQFMKSWLGGNAAQKKMTNLLLEKGYNVIGGAHVNWKREEGRDKRIAAAVETVCELIK